MSVDFQGIFQEAKENPEYEAEYLTERPLRGVQCEMIKRVEAFIAQHAGGVMTIMSSRQTGKNETAANLQRRHLAFKQFEPLLSKWIRTAPTHVPQIVNSKKRLEELMHLDHKKKIKHPLFLGQKLIQTEGYIWRVGNATVEFMSSSEHSNVVGATASECLDMDEAHKVSKEKFDEDFAPFTASTNAGTLLWGVAADSLDTLEWYRQNNIDNGNKHLNLYYPCEVWAESSKAFAGHLESRVKALGWDHPIIKTQYRLIPVAHEGTYINGAQARALMSGEHERQIKPRAGATYEMLIDLAAGNEQSNPDQEFEGEEATKTDSTIIWIYEVTNEYCANNIFPIVNLVQLYWWTGVDLPKQELEIMEIIEYWKVQKLTVDGVGVGRQMSESLESRYGPFMVNKYIASDVSVSEDCFDLLARLNYSAVKMFQNDGSREWLEFERQVGWAKYISKKGKMNLIKPLADKHIDMVKGLTYINRNKPDIFVHEILSNEAKY